MATTNETTASNTNKFKKIAYGDNKSYILVRHSNSPTIDDVDAIEDLKILDNIKSDHTNLLSVYVPWRRSYDDVIQQLQNESVTATNILDETVRNNVLSALKGVMYYLQGPAKEKKTETGGLVLFAGVVKEYDEKIPILYSAHLLPGKKRGRQIVKTVNISMYRCDSKFWTENLKQIVGLEK